MKLPPYPKYKDSGVPWLGDIPEHWEARRLANSITTLESGLRDQGDLHLESGVPSLGGEHIGADGNILRKNMKYIPPSFFARLQRGKLQEGDILLVKDGATIGKTAWLRELPYPQAAVNEHVYILRAQKDCEPGYLFNCLRSSRVQEGIWQVVTGSAQPGLNALFTKSIMLPTPPLPEQTAIAQYLDEVDQQVRQAIQTAQKLIDLLTQQRQAIIHRAVTRGLNPDAPLKPSNIPWLGDIPEHWGARRLKAVADVRLSSVNRNIVEGEELVQFLGTDTVYRTSHIYRDTTLPQASATAAAIQLFALRKGDIVITKDSLVPNRIAVPAVVVEEPDSLSVCGYHLALIRPHEQTNNTPYLFYAFRSTGLSNHFVNMAHGTTIIGIGQGEIGAASVPYPPPDEQVAIAAFLDEAISDIELGMARADQQIQLLQEYRTRLIADVVTGKLDVRHLE